MGEGLFSKIKGLIGIEDVEEEDELEEDAPVLKQEPRKSMELKPSPGLIKMEPKDHRENRGISMTQGIKTQNQMKLLVTEPRSFDECPKLVDNLKSKKPVIINLEKLDQETARKIFDFLSGATYALDGNVQRVANNIFIFAPENVDVTAQMDQKAADYRDGIHHPWK